MNSLGPYELWSARGSGGAIIEALLALTGAPFRVIDAPPWEDGPHLEKLRQINPLGQVPVLVLPDGTVMTESGAIVLLLGERHPETRITPAPDDPLRPAFLRWLFFVTASLYSTFRFDDFPERWVSDEDSQTQLREAVGEARKAMLRQLDAQASAPYFLGDRLTALDLYITAMAHWKPRYAWVSENCPRLDAVARRVKADPQLASVFDQHFG